MLNPAFYGGAQNNNKINADKSKKASKAVTTETKNENKGFFSKINEYRKNNTGMFVLIIFVIIIAVIIVALLTLYLVKRFKERHLGYSNNIYADKDIDEQDNF